MWTEKLERRAENMRAILRTERCKAQISDEARTRGLKSALAVLRQRGDIHRNSTTEIRVPEPMKRLRGRGLGNVEISGAAYPPCPRCNGATSLSTIRAGFAHGIQRYRCSYCRRTFSGGKIVITIEPFDYQMICYRCGGMDVSRCGRGADKFPTGRDGFCNKCKRTVVQGGLTDLQKCHLIPE